MHGSREIDYNSCGRTHREVWGSLSTQGTGREFLPGQSFISSVVSYPRRILGVWPDAHSMPGQVHKTPNAQFGRWCSLLGRYSFIVARGHRLYGREPLMVILYHRQHGLIHSHQLKGMRWRQLTVDWISLTFGDVTDGCRIYYYRASELSHVQANFQRAGRSLCGLHTRREPNHDLCRWQVVYKHNGTSTLTASPQAIPCLAQVGISLKYHGMEASFE